MRVSDDRPPIQDVHGGQGTQAKKGAQGAAAPFESVLQEKGRADSREALNRLLERIAEQGERIARRRDINDVKKYRELVSDFLEEALRSTYQADRDRSFDGRGRIREYSTVKKINGELESLARNVLDEQRGNLEILQQLGTIRGLLIDLLV